MAPARRPSRFCIHRGRESGTPPGTRASRNAKAATPPKRRIAAVHRPASASALRTRPPRSSSFSKSGNFRAPFTQLGLGKKQATRTLQAVVDRSLANETWSAAASSAPMKMPAGLRTRRRDDALMKTVSGLGPQHRCPAVSARQEVKGADHLFGRGDSQPVRAEGGVFAAQLQSEEFAKRRPPAVQAARLQGEGLL